MRLFCALVVLRQRGSLRSSFSNCQRGFTVFLPLFGLPEIDDERIPSFDLVRRLVNRQILDALLGFRYKIRRRLRHCCLLSHGRLPQWPIARCRPL